MPRSRPARVRDRVLFSEAPRMTEKLCFGTRRSPLLVSGVVLACLAVSPLLAQSSLKSRKDFVVGDHPVGIVTTDYDGDGFLDLITVNQQTAGVGDIALIKGFGDGTFRKVTS